MSKNMETAAENERVLDYLPLFRVEGQPNPIVILALGIAIHDTIHGDRELHRVNHPARRQTMNSIVSARHRTVLAGPYQTQLAPKYRG